MPVTTALHRKQQPLRSALQRLFIADLKIECMCICFISAFLLQKSKDEVPTDDVKDSGCILQQHLRQLAVERPVLFSD
jgi:hypothetical protein